jgi:RNA polymerase sigma-70 factor, ECF subfamily
MDDKIFQELRPLLFSIAYRILGVRADTEDVLQEAYLRWRQADEVRSPKAFLTTVVSRLALDALKAAHRKREVYVGPWLPEPIIGPVSEPVELAESLSIAFLRLLESLGPSERVAFLMREVFDADYSAVAEALDTSEANARQLVSRAKAHLRNGRPPRERADPARHPQLLAAFLQACAEGDSGSLVALLKEDSVLYTDGGGRTRAALNPILGADRICRFVFGLMKKGLGEFGGYPAQVNGLAGAVITLDGKPAGVMTIAIDGDRIAELYYVLNPDKLRGLVENRH